MFMYTFNLYYIYLYIYICAFIYANKASEGSNGPPGKKK